jgi:endonuclease-3
MWKRGLRIPELLTQLESFHGKQECSWPTDPYLFLVWWHCGYPASDAACAKGWESLNEMVGTEPERLLSAPPAILASALRPGGMVPELRAMRLKEIAARVKDEFGRDLRSALVGPIAQVRKALRTFPSIGDPGVDRILLFGGLSPTAAVPSNCPHVLVRVQRGQESENYPAIYREAKKALEMEVPETFDARIRAYLLLKRHGQDVCNPAKPKCKACPIRSACTFAKGYGSDYRQLITRDLTVIGRSR